MDIYFMLLCICLFTIYYVVYLICMMHLVCNVKETLANITHLLYIHSVYV